MITRIITAASGPRFSAAERRRLLALRARYQAAQHLFTDRELAHLSYWRWLVNSPGWNRALDQVSTAPRREPVMAEIALWMPGFIG